MGSAGQRSGDERRRPGSGTRATAGEIHDNVLADAKKELERPVLALAWSGLSAGLAIAFCSMGASFLASIAPPHLAHAAAAAGYPLGFLFVVLARNQLFTENTLEPVIPLLETPSAENLVNVLRLWSVVLGSNLIGAAIIALAISRTEMLPAPVLSALMEHARESTAGGFGRVVFLAIFAGWLVALMAWLVAATHATGAQIAIVWLTTAPISALGFRHAIAGSVNAFVLVWSGDAGLAAMLGGFLVPALIGNVVGGVALVALLNHGQVKAGRQ
ncbi:MAG TPA: formate/nitrite transporter family protein [Thermoanaerobaculia bacterium]|nr:formate/nitrite transporter family protein [Thermoanaerobaculia bacterium]